MSTVLVSHPRPGVCLVTLNRPESLNSMTPELVVEAHRVFDAIAADASVRAVVLTGAGRGFSSGHDLRELAEVTSAHDTRAALADQEAFAALIERIHSIPQPVIAAVNGPAAGGGLAMALASDVRICSESARFNAAFVRIGLSGCDVGVSYFLPRIVSTSVAFEMMLTGRLVDAAEAFHHGLVLRVVPDESVVGEALAIADAICANSPFGVRMTKSVMWQNAVQPSLRAALELENRTQVLCVATPDHAEAMAAFVEKRAPNFDS